MNHQRHIITEDDIKNFEQHLTSSSGMGSMKQIKAHVEDGVIRYVVKDHGKEVYNGYNRASAVNAYNDAP